MNNANHTPPEQRRFLGPGSGIVWTNVDTSTSAPRPGQQALLTSGSRIVWTDAGSQNEGPSCSRDPSALAKEVELAPEHAEPCAKEVENMKARIAAYKDFICDLVHKESQHAIEAGWTPEILNILNKTAEELAKLSTEAQSFTHPGTHLHRLFSTKHRAAKIISSNLIMTRR